jgi:hypothetical protein
MRRLTPTPIHIHRTALGSDIYQPRRSVLAGLIEFQRQPEFLIDVVEFGSPYSANEGAQPFESNGRRLLDKYLRLFVPDGNCRTEAARSSRAGGRSDEKG